jgi:hypothetical protein
MPVALQDTYQALCMLYDIYYDLRSSSLPWENNKKLQIIKTERGEEQSPKLCRV